MGRSRSPCRIACLRRVRAIRRRILPRQAHQFLCVVDRRRRLRPVCAAARQAHRPPHPGRADDRSCRTWSGAEGIKAANYIFTVAPQDGTAIGALSRNIGIVQLYEAGNPAIQFDARKMHWIGSPQQEVGTGIFSTTKGLRSIDDLKTREVTASSTARNAPTSVYPRMLNALYGTKIKVIEGYPGLAGGADRVRARRGRGLCIGRHQRADAGADGGRGSRAAAPRRSCRWA